MGRSLSTTPSRGGGHRLSKPNRCGETGVLPAAQTVSTSYATQERKSFSRVLFFSFFAPPPIYRPNLGTPVGLLARLVWQPNNLPIIYHASAHTPAATGGSRCATARSPPPNARPWRPSLLPLLLPAPCPWSPSPPSTRPASTAPRRPPAPLKPPEPLEFPAHSPLLLRPAPWKERLPAALADSGRP